MGQKRTSTTCRSSGSTHGSSLARVTATSGLQIAAFDAIMIEDDVLMASNVFLSDGMHAFETANVPYRYQGIF